MFLFVVQDKLRFDPESEIATTGLRVSLICPVSIVLYIKGICHGKLFVFKLVGFLIGPGD